MITFEGPFWAIELIKCENNDFRMYPRHICTVVGELKPRKFKKFLENEDVYIKIGELKYIVRFTNF